MGSPDHGSFAGQDFEVGVAVLPLRQIVPAPRPGSHPAADSGIPGFDEAQGRARLHSPDKVPFLIEKGEAAVRAATEAIAAQIGLAAQRIAASIAEQVTSPPAESGGPGALGLDSVSVSFGVTLAAGIQAMFTAQADSSVQVTVTLSPRPPGPTPPVPQRT
jgi:hypothetical protein